MTTRAALFRKIFAGAKSAGLSKEDLSAIAEQNFGKASLKALTDKQLEGLIAQLRTRGVTFKPAKRPRQQATDPQSKMIVGLWTELSKAGVLRDGSDKALLTFCKRTVPDFPDALRWADTCEKGPVIEALKAWVQRACPEGYHHE